MKLPDALIPLQARWRALDAREQTLVRSAALMVGLALVWWVLVAPPLHALRQADALHRNQDAQWQKMQTLQAQAQALMSQPKMSRDDAVRALEASVKQRLGATAQLTITGDRATLTLRSTPADALAQWLAQARLNARAVPTEGKLVRTAATATAPTTVGTTVVSPTATLAGAAAPTQAPVPAWDGTLVLNLPNQ